MRNRVWVIAATVMTGVLLSVGSIAQPVGARAKPVRPAVTAGPPVVVELFTAQGCGGCIEANAVVERAAAEPGVIALTYGVDYWDYLGWTDTFARPEFTQRQRDYRVALRQRGVSTPQVVIDGRRQVSGARGLELETAIVQEAGRQVWPPEIEFRETGDRVGIGSGRPPSGGAEVLAVTYTPGPQVVEVSRGENRGQTVRHINVVRDIVNLGDWRGRPILFDLPQTHGGDAVVVMIQGKTDRRILGAAVRN
ncbi:MAG: DUF1223 domain-containing protein [Brevundimonas sp.]|uniref:DUF1223 domain-containing protein n=1 Tax=Brevundimonas sp. TaxID=1871086 RepID=UPI002716A582|nr:DUF1223 domain-containing protein [Brevundimonas sp.]MDO9607676.1 DUF1223 domain-containing protein [Brevundimonas sp.]